MTTPSRYKFTPTYLAAFARPDWSVDLRHLFWLHSVLMQGGFTRTLEIGCLLGGSSTAFIEAVNAGQRFEAHFCDINITDTMRQVVDHCAFPDRIRLWQESSVYTIRERGPFDFVFVDGDHSLKTVAEEVSLLLESRVRCVMAHDTSATIAGYRECEGSAYLKRTFQAEEGYWCLEDAERREGELTHRGLFFATRDAGLFEAVRDLYRYWSTLPAASIQVEPLGALQHPTHRAVTSGTSSSRKDSLRRVRTTIRRGPSRNARLGLQVLTAGNNLFSVGVMALAKSVRGMCRLTVIDLGLSDHTLAVLAAEDVRVVTPVRLPIPRTVRWWETWNKPWYFDYVDSDAVLWLDADCVVVGDLEPLGELVLRRTFLTEHPGSIDGSFRHRRFSHDVRRHLSESSIPLLDVTINAGVIGMRRSDSLLNTWRDVTLALAADEHLRASTPWADEDTLHLALEKTGRASAIVRRPEWNRFVINPAEICSSPDDVVSLAKRMAQSGDTIVHFTGHRKPWMRDGRH